MGDRGRSSYRESNGLSSFYREKFGSHSPEEYKNLRISGFDDRLQRDEIKDKLFGELRKFAPFEIKVLQNHDGEGRLAYVNFERKGCARTVRHKCMDRLKDTFGRRIKCDPSGILRDQEGKYIPDRFHRAQEKDYSGDSNYRGGSPDRGGGGRNRPREKRDWKLIEDDAEATRSLFVGNMPADIRENEIRRVFDRYGEIEDIDIKTPNGADAAYAFVAFKSVEHAIDARHDIHDTPIRPGSSRCKIGYGKSQASRRLFVGGLGSWTTSDMLTTEFDRYGPIEDLEYNDGDDCAYITFSDMSMAKDALSGMRNFPLGGREHRIIVDYAKDSSARGTASSSSRDRKRRASQSPPGKPEATRTPPSAGTAIRTFEDLDEEYATTWSGLVSLKKAEYSVKLYRVFGAEKLLQKLLRDEEQNALTLAVTQRLSVMDKEGNELFERLRGQTSKQLALMIGIGKTEDDTKIISKYLREKEAAGVTTVEGATVYIFAYCETAIRLLEAYAPNIRVISDDNTHLLFALVQKPTE